MYTLLLILLYEYLESRLVLRLVRRLVRTAVPGTFTIVYSASAHCTIYRCNTSPRPRACVNSVGTFTAS